jgi:hypothetical protein
MFQARHSLLTLMGIICLFWALCSFVFEFSLLRRVGLRLTSDLDESTRTSIINTVGSSGHLSQAQRQAAMAHIHILQQLYKDASSSRKENIDWDFSMRGIGWLYENFHTVLTLVTPPTYASYSPRQRQFQVNIAMASAAHPSFEPSQLTIWVRVSSDYEIFSGAAVFDISSNQWHFPFRPLVPQAKFRAEAKLISYKGSQDFNSTKCKTNQTQADAMPYQHLNLTYPRNFGIRGFKFYDDFESCCEICTRIPNCQKWATPSPDKQPMNGRPKEGQPLECHLYLSDSAPVLRQSHRRLYDAIGYGISRHEPTAYYIGCGWSYWLSNHYPCLKNTDDTLFGSDTFFHLVQEGSDPNLNRPINTSDVYLKATAHLPACTLLDETFDSNVVATSRWFRLPLPSTSSCPLGATMDKNFSTQFPKGIVDPERPECWHQENMAILGEYCVEMNCGFIHSTMWRSWLHQETQFYGIWTPEFCKYRDLSLKQLQTCVDRRRISQISVVGCSVAGFLSEYVNQRLQGVHFVNSSETLSVILDTLWITHKLWHDTATIFKTFLNELKPINASYQEHFFISSFFYSSEREPHVLVDRSLQFSRMAYEVLEPKGYKMINAFYPTAAFTYDSAGQLDGLHIAGPPMKAITNKFFHHLCSEYV